MGPRPGQLTVLSGRVKISLRLVARASGHAAAHAGGEEGVSHDGERVAQAFDEVGVPPLE
jgi:hypothetical protein